VKTEKSSSERSLNFLIGAVMKKTDGRASPPLVRALLLERLAPPAIISSSARSEVTS